VRTVQTVEYEPGGAEAAVLRDLARFPEDIRSGGIAMVAVLSARALDEGGLAPRDAQGYLREIRMSMVQLADMAPGDRKGDVTDEVRAAREKRLSAG
jgi:hypothetical protein